MTKQIILQRNKDKQVGNVRVSEELYEKLATLSKKHEVSIQTIVREILEAYIDDVSFK